MTESQAILHCVRIGHWLSSLGHGANDCKHHWQPSRAPSPLPVSRCPLSRTSVTMSPTMMYPLFVCTHTKNSGTAYRVVQYVASSYVSSWPYLTSIRCWNSFWWTISRVCVPSPVDWWQIHRSPGLSLANDLTLSASTSWSMRSCKVVRQQRYMRLARPERLG